MTAAPPHLDTAEAGKRAALRGDHKTALGHYREAMKLATKAGAPEVFFRHYLEASLESLELMGELENVLEYCDRAITHYTEHPPPNHLAELDLATVHQRRGIILLKLGDQKRALEALDEAFRRSEALGAPLELTRLLRRWLQQGLTITQERVLSEQRRCRYFSVRSDAVRNLTRGHP